MAKKVVKLKAQEVEDGPHGFPSSKMIGEALGVSSSALMTRKMFEIEGLLWNPEGTSGEDRSTRIVRAIELYESLEPADGAESMLALQMVGTHDATYPATRGPEQASGQGAPEGHG